MKYCGMYWSQKGAVRMAKLVIDVSANRLREIYFGNWRDNYGQPITGNGWNNNRLLER